MAQAIGLPRARPARAHAPLRAPWPAEAWLAFALSLALYLAVAAILVFRGNALGGDGMSRVEAANRILFSRDPHLAAVGFVWSPLPNLVLLPLVSLKVVWPALIHQAVAGAVVSALFMAGAVAQLLGIGRDVGLRGSLRRVLALGFAVHPMIILFAANSMSEAPFIFFLLLVVRHVMRWLATAETAPLVAVGMYLGLAYLTRYDAVAAAAAVAVVVAVATYARGAGNHRTRASLALNDCLIATGPFVAVFVLWALISWLITGIAFQQFSSVYGTAAQLDVKGLGHPTLDQELHFAAQGVSWMLALEPLLPLAVLAVVLAAVKRHSLRVLAPVGVLSAVVTFMLWAHSTGTILRSLRYFIVVIPLVSVALAVTLAPAPWPSRGHASVTGQTGRRYQGRARRLTGAAVVSACVVVTASAVPAGARAVLSTSTNQNDAYPLQALINSGSPTREQSLASKRWMTDREVSAYLDALHLGRGAVLVDDFLGFVVVMASAHPDQFVVSSDRDFQSILDDPAQAGVEYLLVPPIHDTDNLGGLDAVNRRYPGIYDTGAGIASLVRQFDDVSDLGVNWRLFRVNPQQ